MKVIRHAAARATRGKGLTLTWGVHDFPVGKILVALSPEGLCWLGINCGAAKLRQNWPGAKLVENAAATKKTAGEIARLWPYSLEKLSIPLVLYGTAFQLEVWQALLGIKSGKTVTYAELARKLGRPQAARAVGSAVGKNTVSIVVPCHRVVNKDSARINYGWGPALKKALLAGEAAK